MNEKHRWIVKVLLVCVGCVLIMGLMVFGYIQYQNRQNLLLASNQFSFAMNAARAEAIELGVAVTVCALKADAPLRCGEKVDWANGWMVFLGDVRQGEVGVFEQKLMQGAHLPKGIWVMANVRFVTYDWVGGLLTPVLVVKMGVRPCYGPGVKLHTVSVGGQLQVEGAGC